jgi:hypothetical protein
MGEAHHNFTAPLHTHGRARMEAAQQTMTTPQAHPQEPSGTLGMEVATRVTMKVVTTPLMVILSLASKPKSLPLLGTPIGTLHWSCMSVMGLTKLSARWKGSDNSSNGWMTLEPCKQKCKHPSTQTSMMYDLFGHFKINPDA